MTVVGTRWQVPDHPTTLLMFMFHHLMIRRGYPPRDALRGAQLWMLEPVRIPPPEMPAEFPAKNHALYRVRLNRLRKNS